MSKPPPLRISPQKRWKLEHRLKVWLGNDISTPRGRRRAKWAVQLLDHAFLRRFWHNFEEVAPGIFRANQPSEKRLAFYKSIGIKAILSLRGHNSTAVYAFQREACARLGLPFYAVTLSARALRPAKHYLEMLEIFDRIERPFLFHCKSGADRTGLAAAFYLIDQEGRTVEEVRHQLSWRYIHSSRAATGVLDHMLEAFRRSGQDAGLDLRTWLREVYDPEALTAEFTALPYFRRPQR